MWQEAIEVRRDITPAVLHKKVRSEKSGCVASRLLEIANILDGMDRDIVDALRIPDNISLLFLPPYSPALNAQENIWQYLRQNLLAGRIFDTYDDIVDVCCNARKALTHETGRIASIATRDWLSRKTSWGRGYNLDDATTSRI